MLLAAQLFSGSSSIMDNTCCYTASLTKLVKFYDYHNARLGSIDMMLEPGAIISEQSSIYL